MIVQPCILGSTYHDKFMRHYSGLTSKLLVREQVWIFTNVVNMKYDMKKSRDFSKQVKMMPRMMIEEVRIEYLSSSETWCMATSLSWRQFNFSRINLAGWARSAKTRFFLTGTAPYRNKLQRKTLVKYDVRVEEVRRGQMPRHLCHDSGMGDQDSLRTDQHAPAVWRLA